MCFYISYNPAVSLLTLIFPLQAGRTNHEKLRGRLKRAPNPADHPAERWSTVSARQSSSRLHRVLPFSFVLTVPTTPTSHFSAMHSLYLMQYVVTFASNHETAIHVIVYPLNTFSKSLQVGWYRRPLASRGRRAAPGHRGSRGPQNHTSLEHVVPSPCPATPDGGEGEQGKHFTLWASFLHTAQWSGPSNLP